ncbi:DUF3866 family protein [Paenibacillus sp. LMG 31458]|uniref:DUF3866 family protein n=1 Tax=Paenibacillus phytorum TaxID=2654977 RepID=A0ABX1XUD8_9BACL|nr:DUF3866 family protein [Paenibacillus phytorum]NOU72162.1 DUF3866 family protein [Paenibacillus phytorum]
MLRVRHVQEGETGLMMRDEGTVADIVSVREGLQIVTVWMRSGALERAVHYTDTMPLLSPGDVVNLNVTAMKLRLGSGGFHIVISIRNRKSDHHVASKPSNGHIMKLKYTPMQRSVFAIEEPASSFHSVFQGDMNLEGMPVLLGELHSMLPVVMCWLRYRHQQRKSSDRALEVAYIMTDGGALPLAWSEHVAILENMEWLKTTITYGQAYGGKVEAVNKYSALVAAKHIVKADISVVTMGPGIVGTNTRYGFSGLEVGELVNAVYALGGIPVVIPRISFADPRIRHQGISHHTLTALQLAARCPAVVPLPLLEAKESAVVQKQAQNLQLHRIVGMPSPSIAEITEAFSMYPQPITSMGRELSQDPAYFQAICAAADCANQLHNPLG